MTSRLPRSSSLGAVPRQKSLARSRAESSAATPLEVRCACQFFQSDSLIPERINPIGSRPPSRVGNTEKPLFCSKHNISEADVLLEEGELSGSILSFGKTSVPDYYAETNKENHPPYQQFDQLSSHSEFPHINYIVDDRPPIEIETFKAELPRIVTSVNNSNNLNKPFATHVIPHNDDATHLMNALGGQKFSSQKSLDRYSSSTLLAKYRPKSQSHAPSLQGSSNDIRSMFPRITKTVSFDYGKPSSNLNSEQLENPNYDQYHRMSPMVFPVRERLQKIERMSVQRDHEYEPIGEPSQIAFNDENVDEMAQNKRPIDTLEGASSGNEKKLLRTPTEDSEDNISAQDFQDQIENRFFRQGFEPIKDNVVLPHPEITVEEAVIIDEEPVHREIPKKKKGFMESAQQSGLTFHKKIKAQACSLKTSLNNKIKKKPKEKPVAVEVEEIGDDLPEDEVENENIEAIKINVQDVDEESAKASKQSKMSKLKMNIKKPTMPKFKKPDFSSLRKLGRSKSMREESSTATGGESSSLHTPEVAITAEPTPRKKFDFGTYPRMIRDKFRRSKLPVERSDRSMISDSPAADEDFNRISSTFVQRGPVASRWPEYATEEESGKYQHFDSETDLERERMEFEETRHVMTEEQRQLVDMDRENLQIHLMAKQEKFRKPYIERQESDIASEDDKLMWSGMLNKNAKEIENEDFDDNALRYKYDQLDEDVIRSSTPKSNQETQSSGSSGTRRRRGYIDDEEDEEYFIREQKISSNLSREGYIDAALKEGLSNLDGNALAQMGDDEHEFSPERPIRSLKRKKKVEPPHQDDEMVFNDYFKTYPPHRPVRKQKSLSEEPNDEEIMLHDDASDIIDEHDIGTFKGIEHPDLDYMREDYDNDMDYNISNLPVPPTPPRRRKKKIRSMLQHQHILSNSNKEKPMPNINDNIIVYRQEHEFVPLAQEEHFTTPTPTPRRTRSRSQISGYTLDDADSFKKDSFDGFTAMNILENDKENNKDYATVRKELPSRPVRRKRSTKSLGDRQFNTLPMLPKRSDHDVRPPRPPRNYSTINASTPNKPPRRKSAGSLVEISKTIKDDDYEEILDVNTLDNRLSQRLKSGDVVNKMKDRPLPPPPRPKREHKKPKKETPDDEEKFDKDDGAERIALEEIINHSIEPAKDELEIQENIEDLESELKLEEQFLREEKSSLPRQDSEFSEPERPIEVEVSTQTDPVPDEEFTMDDDEDIDLEEYLASDGKIKTLEDILKEEQEAEMERARQLAEAENLSKGIQRFRESNQRSLSEKSGRSKSLSRPITPSAVVVERKKSSPMIFESQPQVMTEAGLFIHPITYDDYGIQQCTDEVVEPLPVDETDAIEAIDVNNNLNEEQVEEPQAISPEPDIAEILKRAQEFVNEDEGDDEELDAEMQRKIEEMIESVMSSAREEADWIKRSTESVTEEPKEVNLSEEEKPVEEGSYIDLNSEPPVPPPRRKASEEEEDLQPLEDDEPSIKIDALQVETSHAVSEERPSSPFPSRLHLASLEIDNLSVNQLQAGRITASEIDSHSVTTNEFECKLSSTMPNSTSTTIEIPPGLIEEIVERVRSAERAEHQVQQAQSVQVQESQEEAPIRPPLPTQYTPTSQVPPSFFQLQDNYSEEEQQPHHPAPHRRRKHHTKQRKESTSEEDYQKDQRTRSRTNTASGSEQSVMSLGGQFLRACGNSLMDTGNHVMEVLRAASKDEQSRDLHIAIIILIIIVAGLFLMGMGEKSIHHHHWDFFNPGENR